jgi:hypothetical protein
MSDEAKNVPQLRIGLINEILSEAICIRIDQPFWKFFRWTTVLLLCADATHQWNGLDLDYDDIRREISAETDGLVQSTRGNSPDSIVLNLWSLGVLDLTVVDPRVSSTKFRPPITDSFDRPQHSSSR